jgi:hypothetical protein
MLKPLTIEDLQESAENYKHHYKERKLKYMAETEATEEEFLMREFELWDDCVHLLNFEKKYNETDWYALDSQHVKVLVEGISLMGFDKIYHPSQRKLEYLESLKVSGKNTSDQTTLSTSVNHLQLVSLEVKKDPEIAEAVIKEKKKKPAQYYLRSICIAIYCMGITVDSQVGMKLLRKYTGNPSPPGLKNNVVSKASEITSIAENPHKDKWRKKIIEQAKRLLIAEKNQKAIEAITKYQEAFQANLDSPQ